jgi:hypothetical protein
MEGQLVIPRFKPYARLLTAKKPSTERLIDPDPGVSRRSWYRACIKSSRRLTAGRVSAALALPPQSDAVSRIAAELFAAVRRFSRHFVTVEGATLTLTLGEDDTYTWIFTKEVPEESEDEAGAYVVTGSTLTLSQTGEGSPESFTIVRDGNTMTLTVTEEDFDFTEVEEPAILVITLTR